MTKDLCFIVLNSGSAEIKLYRSQNKIRISLVPLTDSVERTSIAKKDLGCKKPTIVAKKAASLVHKEHLWPKRKIYILQSVPAISLTDNTSSKPTL